MQFPITLTFKLLAIASQIYIRDGRGGLLGYVKQKLFKLKEEINVFADEQQDRLLYSIRADRMLDLSARFSFTDGSGRPIGSIKRQGMRSIWKANYEIADASGKNVMVINEENAWVKVIDALIGEVPVVGMFSGYFFNPAYIISDLNGSRIARLKKRVAFFEGVFELTSETALSDEMQELLLLGVLPMTLLERARG